MLAHIQSLIKKKNERFQPIPPDQMQYVGFRMRLYASLVDSILMFICISPLSTSIIRWIYGEGVPNQEILQEIQQKEMDLGQFYTFLIGHPDLLQGFLVAQAVPLFFSFLTVYLFWSSRSATPGKMLLRMRIVDAKTGKQPTQKQFLIRLLGYTVSTLPFLLGFFWMVLDKKRQCFHDKLAGTVVVKLPKSASLPKIP